MHVKYSVIKTYGFDRHLSIKLIFLTSSLPVFMTYTPSSVPLPDFYKNTLKTRIHSSRMRTGRTLTVFRSLLSRGGFWSPGGGWVGTCQWSRGVGGVPAWSGGKGVPPWSGGGYLPGPGGGLPGQVLPL